MSLYVRIKKKLEHFTLDVEFDESNQIFALLGASGSGKSMTLKCIAGIEVPDSGRIVLNDRILYDSDQGICLSPQERRVGYLFQDYALFPHMTVEENILCGMKVKDRKKVSEMLDSYELSGMGNRKPGYLSGGQRQRAAILRMLAAEPECVLLDEPFSALDENLRWKLEKDLKSRMEALKLPVVFVTHSRDEVYRMADRVGCISSGHLETVAEKESFFADPETKTAAILSGCKNYSKIRWIDENHVFAEDWNTVLTVNAPQRGREACIWAGIRAHDFIPGGSGENAFAVETCAVTEDLFEWNVEVKPEGASKTVLWKLAKKNVEKGSIHPESLTVSKDAVLLLK